MDSSMVESTFEVSDDSDAFSPEPKPVKAKPAAKKAPAAAATKAKPVAKKMTQTTLKPKAALKKRPKSESDEENIDLDTDSVADDSLLSNTPPSAKRQKKTAPAKMSSGNPLQTIDNGSFGLDGASEKTGSSKFKPTTASEQYQRLTQLEHILKRPDTYIGSVERTESKMWVYNSDTEAMECRDVSYVPGLYKIFDEILVNAADNKIRDKNMNELKVTIDREGGVISVRNNGRGIPIEIHKDEKLYIPELIFGHLLTSSNYNDDEQKVTGGRNGYGAKLCNIYSTEFILETADSKSKQKYKQTWTHNMSKMGKASITQHKGEDFTKITFKPDFKKFSMDKMDADFEALVKRRVYDMAGTCKDVKVYLNGDRVKVGNFKKYMEMYTKAIKTENLIEGGASKEDSQVILTDNPHDRWEIGFAVSDGSFQQVSFVNSIATTSGGTHVNYIADQIVTKLAEIVKKKNKGGVILKPAQIRNHIFLFVNCLITNPSFTSQTKEQLTSKQSQFGSKCTVSEKFLKAIAKTEAVNNIIHFAQQKADQVLKKSDGNRRTRMSHSKLTDANKAGTNLGHRCTLILTEGDSASLLALAGRAVLDPDLIGVFPLRGKLLNVRDASIDQISKNQEIQNIKKFMGLQHKKEYTDTKSLRYGHLMIMTDQDHDGSHIKGLIINFLEASYPSLLKIPGFLQEFITPIVKVWKGDPKNPKSLKSFFTMPEYEAWKELPGHSHVSWQHKYYKGLGTSSPADAEIYFRDLDRHLKEFDVLRKNEVVDEPQMIDLVFSKTKADARKEWLRQFRPGTFLDMTTAKITYDDFINKELILFSMADNMRSIPSIVDGLKPGQRKVMYTCFRRNLKKDVKVVELAGSVSGLTAYAAGDTSLQGTIVGLAQNFVGSNNLNCLEPSGNFGSRLQGGQDCASARYIYTRLSPLARKLFHTSDEPLLTYNTDDGKTIEPETYVPILPMILVNGADGIGSGWSTSIPNYNPEDIVENLKLRMAGSSKDDMKPMKPWFRGWTNEVEDIGGDRFKFTGTIRQVSDTEIEVTELPVRMWTQEFKDKLEDILKAEKGPSFIKDYTEYNTPVKVHFIIKMEDKHMKYALTKGLEETFKTSKTMATSNLVAFDSQSRIQKYATVLDIMEEFYHVRLRFYQKRKEYLLNEMQMEHDKLSNQARFVRMIVDGSLVVSKKKKTVLIAELQKKQFKPIPKIVNAQKQGEFEPVAENEGEEEEMAENEAVGVHDYDYLLGMPIWSLTEERIEKLMKQIGDKDVEIDTLIKTSEKQLWTNDLDDFLKEWRFQLADEAKREKEIAAKGRRASTKLRIAASKAGPKKRKVDYSDNDDSEFAVPKAKAPKPKASNSLKRLMDGAVDDPSHKAVAKPRTGLLGSVEQSPTSRPPAEQQGLIRGDTIDPVVDEDGVQRVSAYEPIKLAPEVAKPKKTSRKIIDDDDDEDMFMEVARKAKVKDTSKMPAAANPAARQARTASRKPVKYAHSDDSDASDSDGNFDVGNMVKGIGETTAVSTNSKPLFSNSASASRPSSSHSVTKARLSRVVPLSDDDETDYKNLVPRDSPMKPAARNARDAARSDDDDDLLDITTARPPLKTISKPSVAKPASRTEISKSAAVGTQEVKPTVLSPAAKAYAAKQAKAKAAIEAGGPPPAPPKLQAVKKAPATAAKKTKKKTADSDDEMDDIDDIANDLLSDEDGEVGVATARPSRRAASAQPTGKSKYVVDEDDEDEEDFEESEADYGDDDSE